MALIEIGTRPTTTIRSTSSSGMAAGNNWPFERAGEDEIGIVVTGRWTNYQVSFTWMERHRGAASGLRLRHEGAGAAADQVQQLIALINEQLWIGHFDVWMQNGVVMFRHALVLAGGVAASGRQCEAVLGTRARFLRALFSGVSVRDLGGQIGARGDGFRHVRDLGRGVTDGGPSRGSAIFSGLLVLVGAGKMGGALLEGWLRLGLDPKNVAVLEPQPSPQIAALAQRGLRLNPDPQRARRRRRHRHRGEAASGGAGDRRRSRRCFAVRPSWCRSWPGARCNFSPARWTAPLRAGARHAEYAGRDRPRHHRRGAARRQRRAARACRTGCFPRPARSSGSRTKR